MAGGMAPSAGRHSGLDGLARPAGLSHMRLELEMRAPGREQEHARLGWAGEGALNLTFWLPCPQPSRSPSFFLRPLDAPLEGQGQLPQGVKQGPCYWQGPTGISDREGDVK